MLRLAIASTLALATGVGCRPLASGPGGDSVAALWHAPPATAAPPVAIQPATIVPTPSSPATVIYSAPGAPLTAQPSVVLPPATTGPQPLLPPPPVSNWWDVLPAEAGAISPDFGLPAAPVVENRVANPLVVPVANNELAWDQLIDVVTDYFPIKREQSVQQIGGVLTEGFVETPFQFGATLFEPQRNDSVGRFNRWQSTLQSIRRKAFINVQPTTGGYAVGVNVIKQIENLPRPELSLASASVLRSDNALPTTRRGGIDQPQVEQQWIDLGRDEPLEQELLRRIQERLASPLSPTASQPVF